MHYTRWLRHGLASYTVITPKGDQAGLSCLIEGCNSPMKYKGFCSKHYKRLWRHGDPEKTLISSSEDIEFCKAPNCDELARYVATGLCNTHHQRVTRYGRFDRIRGIKGSGSRNSDGYKVFVINGRYFYEHIVFAEKALGRKLPKGAIVHHFNEDKTDNKTPFNLIICPDQGYHLLLHRRAAELAVTGKCSSVNYEYPIWKLQKADSEKRDE